MDIIILYGPRPRCITWLYQALKMCTSITAGCQESDEAAWIGNGIVFLSQICTSLSKNADCLSHIYFPESLHLPGFSCASSVPLVLFNQQSFLAHTWPVICLSRNVKLRNFGLQPTMDEVWKPKFLLTLRAEAVFSRSLDLDYTEE